MSGPLLIYRPLTLETTFIHLHIYDRYFSIVVTPIPSSFVQIWLTTLGLSPSLNLHEQHDWCKMWRRTFLSFHILESTPVCLYGLCCSVYGFSCSVSHVLLFFVVVSSHCSYCPFVFDWWVWTSFIVFRLFSDFWVVVWRLINIYPLSLQE